MKLLIHADDYGLTHQISNGIQDCIDAGVVNSVSLIVNGLAFEDAVARLGAQSHVLISVHLNLAEGRPVSAPQDVPLLIDGDGRLCYSFGGLWALYLRSSAARRAQLRAQITKEYRAQIMCAINAGVVQADSLRVDSHGHYHMIPFVFDCLLDAIGPYPGTYVRITREPWQWPRLSGLRNYLGPNILKHVLLNALSVGASRKIADHNVTTCSYWIGALYSGNMTADGLANGLTRIRSAARTQAVVEATFHPGGGDVSETGIWKTGSAHEHFYLSDDRAREAAELKSPAMRTLIDAAK